MRYFIASDHITDRYSETYRREISVYAGGVSHIRFSGRTAFVL